MRRVCLFCLAAWAVTSCGSTGPSSTEAGDTGSPDGAFQFGKHDAGDDRAVPLPDALQPLDGRGGDAPVPFDATVLPDLEHLPDGTTGPDAQDVTLPPADSATPGCGDGFCALGENCANCPSDCGSCPPCGDGVCLPGEFCHTCPEDCGSCCGDGKCANGEDCFFCPADCGGCCDNGDCDFNETCETCQSDCGPCCGNGYCAGGEDNFNCPEDCGPACGNGACDYGECDWFCEADCDDCCWDGKCNANETCTTCPTDCGPCECVPNCLGKTCGDDDGCGETCGPCAAQPNNDPTRILVYTGNVENLPKVTYTPDECAGDWKDLLYFMQDQPHAPDLFLVQQITDNSQLDALAAQMEAVLGYSYGTIISVQKPGPYDEANCPYKLHQTNAILYRKGRFTYVTGSKSTWRSVREADDGTCVTAQADRYLNLVIKLTDKASGHQIAVASIHWPVVGACGVTNAKLTHDNLKEYTGVEMYIWGGDANLPDLESQTDTAPYKPWYETTNVGLAVPDNLGYRDPIWNQCDQNTASDTELKQCLLSNSTMGQVGVGKRYDYLFFKYANEYKPGDAVNPPPTDGAHTIDFAQAGQAQGPNDDPLPYSQHRSVMSYVYW